jgi:hypothetical protein
MFSRLGSPFSLWPKSIEAADRSIKIRVQGMFTCCLAAKLFSTGNVF